MVYPALLPLMRTPRLPVVDWTDVPPADLNGLVRFAERRNLVSARVPSHFNWPLPTFRSAAYLSYFGLLDPAKGDVRFPETSLICYQLTLHNIPEERRYRLHCGWKHEVTLQNVFTSLQLLKWSEDCVSLTWSVLFCTLSVVFRKWAKCSESPTSVNVFITLCVLWSAFTSFFVPPSKKSSAPWS